MKMYEPRTPQGPTVERIAKAAGFEQNEGKERKMKQFMIDVLREEGTVLGKRLVPKVIAIIESSIEETDDERLKGALEFAASLLREEEDMIQDPTVMGRIAELVEKTF